MNSLIVFAADFQPVRNFLNNASEWLNQHLVNILLIILLGWVIRKFGTTVIMRTIKLTIRSDLYPTENDRKKRLRTLQSLIGAILQVGSWTLVIMLIISELKPSYTTALFTSAGIIGVALGFGAQSLIKDFVTGIFIIIENQYRVGDIITLGQVTGKVEDVTIRTTVLRDLNGYLHHIPNGTITVTTNETMDFGRLNEDLKVTFDTDITKLEKIIHNVGQELAERPEFASKIHDPIKMTYVKHVGGDGVVVKILGKVSLGAQQQIQSEFLRALKEALEKNKIELAK